MDNHAGLPATESRKPSFVYGYIVVAASFLIMATMWGAYRSFGIFLKPLSTGFGWTRAMTSGAHSLSFILTGLLGVAAGRLTDRFGPRIVVTVSGLFLGLGYLLASQVSAIWQLYLFYGVLIGIGMSGSVVPLSSTVARWFVKKRGMMTGLSLSGLGTGMLVMSPIANWLISSYGWRTSYIVVGITVSILVISTAQLLRRDPGQMGQLPDGENALAEKVDSSTPGFSFRQVLHTRQFWMLGVSLLCLCLILEAIFVHVVPHAIGLGISAASAAAVLAVLGGVSTGGRIIMGSVGDRIGNRLAYVICFVFLTISMFWLLAAGELWMFYLFAVVFGFGYGGIGALISPIVAELFGLSSHGVILGVILFSGAIGESSSPVLAGHIFDVTGSYNLAFSILAVVAVIALILVSLLKRAR